MVLSRAIANNIYTICGTPSLERRYPAFWNGGFTAQEYSKGTSKIIDADRLQMGAQAMCLEEMFCTKISEGFIFYGATKRREKVCISDGIRDHIKEVTYQMHQLYDRGYTPKVKMRKSCNACSLKHICLPKLSKNKSVDNYIHDKVEG